ncbi:MAG: hypothetical protein ACFHVJ_19900 [Aestuariibacter sp.]
MIPESQQATFSAQLLVQIKSLLRLSKQYHETDKPLTIGQAETAMAGVTELLDNFPQQTIAQLQLFKSALPGITNLQLNMLITALLLCRRNHWNATTTHQFLCGLLCWAVQHQKPLEIALFKEDADASSRDSSKNVLVKALQKGKRDIWLSVMQGVTRNMALSPSKHLNQPFFHNKAVLFGQMAIYLAIQSMPIGNKKGMTLHHSLQKLMAILHVNSLHYVESLLDYPGSLAPGTHIKTHDKQTCVVLDIYNNELQVKLFDKAEKHYAAQCHTISFEHVMTVLPVLPLRQIKVLDSIWDKEWLALPEHQNKAQPLEIHSYRLDAPPASLRNVLEHMDKQDVSMDELSDLIAHEPTFVEHLKESATKAAREEINVSDLKHSLIFNGLERTKSVLVQHALITRLNQHYFPLQDAFFQFLKFWAHTASSMAKDQPGLVSEQVSNWVYFSCSGLFTNAELKSRTCWPVTQKMHLGIKAVAECQHPEHFILHAQKLAESWYQEKELTLALRLMLAEDSEQSTALKSTAYSLLMSSFIVSYTLFTQGQLDTLENDDLLQQMNSKLRVSSEELAILTKDSLEKSHTYSPISSQTRFSD